VLFRSRQVEACRSRPQVEIAMAQPQFLACLRREPETAKAGVFF